MSLTPLLLIAFFAGAKLQSTPTATADSQTDRSQMIKRYLATFDPSVISGGCAAEQAAYAAAADAFQAASDTLNDTYNDLYDCEQGGGQRPTESLDDLRNRTVSILD